MRRKWIATATLLALLGLGLALPVAPPGTASVPAPILADGGNVYTGG